MDDIPTIDEDNNIINIWDSNDTLYSFNVQNIKDMTIYNLTQFLLSQEQFRGKNLFCYEYERNKEKAEIKVLELKKKLSSLNKKWGKNKTENFHRILFMGENEVYNPQGFVLLKKKNKRISFKRPKSDSRKSDKRKSDKLKKHNIEIISDTPVIPEETLVPPPPPLPVVNFQETNQANIPSPPPMVSPPPMAPPPPPVNSIPTSAPPQPLSTKKQSWWSKRKSKKITTQEINNLSSETILKEIENISINEDQHSLPRHNPITSVDLQNGYLNLNTSKANQLAKNEKFQKILIAWVNNTLSKRKISIENLTSDLRNGVVLINLLEVLSSQEVKKYYKEPKHVPHELENLERVIKFLGVLGLPVNVEPQEIYHGKVGVICSILYSLLNHYKDGTKQKKKKKVDIKVEKIDKEKAQEILSKPLEDNIVPQDQSHNNGNIHITNYENEEANQSPSYQSFPNQYPINIPPKVPPKVPPKMPPPPPPTHNPNVSSGYPIDDNEFVPPPPDDNDIPPPPPTDYDDIDINDIKLDELGDNLMQDILDLDNLKIEIEGDLDELNIDTNFEGIDDVQGFLDNLEIDCGGLDINNFEISFEDRFV